jgi:hypothetical protein
MILSVHLADVGMHRAISSVLPSAPRTGNVPGLHYATTTISAPLSAGLLPRPRLGRVGLIAAWDNDAALEAFLDSHPLAKRLAGGWHVRLQPLRAFGTWSALPDLPSTELPVDANEPVAILTLGRLRLTQTPSFLKASARAEEQAVEDPALLASTGLARPPALVATFSLWKTAAAMRAYANGGSGEQHMRAVRAHAARPFHHESVFVRFRPYASRGTWDGRDPLAPAVPA